MLVVGFLLFFGTGLWGQRTTADVLGKATDSSGAVLTGVRITVHNLDTAAGYTAVTNNSGEHLMTLLPLAATA